MNKEQKFELNISFAKQFSILKDIIDDLEGDLYEYYDLQLIKADQNNKYDEKLEEKILNLKKTKEDLIRIYAKIVSEYS